MPRPNPLDEREARIQRAHDAYQKARGIAAADPTPANLTEENRLHKEYVTLLYEEEPSPRREQTIEYFASIRRE
jgi:hypothetical protein